MIELFTQAHYHSSIEPDDDLSPLWKDVFLHHWKEESQHAILDELEWKREDAKLTAPERDVAVDDLIALAGAVDGMLQAQAASDTHYFVEICGRPMTAAEVEDCQLDYEGVAAKGSMLGSGGMIVMDDSTDLVYQIMRLARFYAHESCAQCTQCREGTAWTTRILERMLAGKGRIEDLDLLLDLSDNMTGKTICVLSDSCAAPVVSGIKKFRGEFEAYLNGNRKTAVAV